MPGFDAEFDADYLFWKYWNDWDETLLKFGGGDMKVSFHLNYDLEEFVEVVSVFYNLSLKDSLAAYSEHSR